MADIRFKSAYDFYLKGDLDQAESILDTIIQQNPDHADALNFLGYSYADRNEKLEEASSVNDDFLANMSHELRTPLNAVLGLAEALESGVYGEIGAAQSGAISGIAGAGRHVLSLIDDALDVAKLESGVIQLDATSFDLEALCRSGIERFEPDVAYKGVTLQGEVASDVRCIEGDGRRVEQIINNLLGNALRFTGSGGSVSLDVRRDSEGTGVYISVQDTGCGIAETRASGTGHNDASGGPHRRPL